jgi:hypothetical protein
VAFNHFLQFWSFLWIDFWKVYFNIAFQNFGLCSPMPFFMHLSEMTVIALLANSLCQQLDPFYWNG